MNISTTIDSTNRMKDTQVFYNGKWHYLSGRNYSSEFHIKLNLFDDTFNDFFSDISSESLGENITFICDEDSTEITDSLFIAKYGAELATTNQDYCPTSFNMIDINTNQVEDIDATCNVVCFSGGIMSEDPVML